MQALVLEVDQNNCRVRLGTKDLEASPGDMLRDPQLVYERAEEVVAELQRQKRRAEVAPSKQV